MSIVIQVAIPVRIVLKVICAVVLNLIIIVCKVCQVLLDIAAAEAVAEVQEDQAVEAVVVLLEEVAEAHQAEVVEDHQEEVAEQVPAEQQCVQAEHQYVEVDKYGHVVHRVVYWMEMQAV